MVLSMTEFIKQNLFYVFIYLFIINLPLCGSQRTTLGPRTQTQIVKLCDKLCPLSDLATQVCF